MFIYNSKKYGQGIYSQGNPVDQQGHLYYGSVIAGIEVRKQIGRKWIYRVRPGNGHAGSTSGQRYQDRFSYFVPQSINNVESQPWRITFAAAVECWKNILTSEQKRIFDIRGSKEKSIPGRSLFISEAMKGVFPMFVDRGDPTTYDFAKEDLTLDGSWHNLDLDGIIPSIARSILISGHLEGNGVDWKISFRKKGNANEINHEGFETIRAGVERHRSGIVAVGSDKIIEYKADNQSWATLSLTIRGWWTNSG